MNPEGPVVSPVGPVIHFVGSAVVGREISPDKRGDFRKMSGEITRQGLFLHMGNLRFAHASHFLVGASLPTCSTGSCCWIGRFDEKHQVQVGRPEPTRGASCQKTPTEGWHGPSDVKRQLARVLVPAHGQPSVRPCHPFVIQSSRLVGFTRRRLSVALRALHYNLRQGRKGSRA